MITNPEQLAPNLQPLKSRTYREPMKFSASLPGNIGKDKSPTTIRQSNKVMEVTCNLTCRAIRHETETGGIRRSGWQKTSLHSTSHLKFLFQTNPF